MTLIDKDGSKYYRYVLFDHYSGNRVIGRIIDWYCKYPRQIRQGEDRWECPHRWNVEDVRFYKCNLDVCDKCYNPKNKYCGHKLVKTECPSDWGYQCDGGKCTRFPEGMIVTVHKSSINTIYDFTKNGKKLYRMYRNRTM